MIVIENHCVDCPKEMGCLGDSCPYMNVPHYYCDKCKEEEKLYHYDGEQLCINCIEKRLEEVVYTG
jgi:hypothetical protein